jgi:hypothetical protein
VEGNGNELSLRVLPIVDSDDQELAEWAGQLHEEILEADTASAGQLIEKTVPEGAKGIRVLAGQLVRHGGRTARHPVRCPRLVIADGP